MSNDPTPTTSAGTLSAKDAAAQLGVSVPTLYAYVSRGLIRSEAVGAARDRRYDARDVQALLERKAQRREPARAAKTALSWGAPVLESAISTIQGGRLYYRGQDAVALAERESFEQVIARLWDRPFGSPLPPAASARLAATAALLADQAPVARFTALLPLAALEDDAALDARPAAIAQAGTRILWLLARQVGPAPTPADLETPIAEVLAQAWGLDGADARRALEAALILAADHELNVSAFTARCVASAGAPPYAVVGAALGALQGARHGGHCERVEALFLEATDPVRAREVLVGRLRRGEEIPGFGQPLYPDGDPRGEALLALTRALSPASAACARALALATGAHELMNERPTIDFGLVALSAALELPRGSALAIFALGRMAGWIAHALEQVAQGGMIRPRAQYTGLPPG